MAGLLQKYYEKAFRKKLLLKPLANGTYEAVDITFNDSYLQKEFGGATVLSPALIIPVAGIKNVAYLAIKEFNKASLHNPFDQDNPGLTEKMLADIIDESIAFGRNMAEGTGDEDKKSKSRAAVTMIAAIVAAVFSLMLYLKVGL